MTAGVEWEQGTNKTPRNLRARRFTFQSGEYLVLSFELGDETLPSTLTPAERDVAASVLAGASNAEIAQQRGTTTRTIANQLASVFQKLGVESRAELISRLSDICLTGDCTAKALRFFAKRVLYEEASLDCGGLWGEFVSGAWRPIDHFDSDRRRYVVAVRSAHELSAREREVLSRRAAGEMLESIAIDYGVTVSCISRTLQAGMKKLGLRDHVELARLFAGEQRLRSVG